MGLRFDLRAANWVAYLITPRAKIPRLQHRGEEVEVLRQFLATMESNFYSSAEGRNDLRLRAGGAHRALVELASDWDQSPREVRVRQALAAVRGYFSRMRWTALIIPSSRRSPIDELLSSAQFLREVVAIRPNDPGLVLQLADPPPGRFSLTDVFPSFKTALAESSRWPGVLLWTPDGDSAFFPLPEDRQAIYERVTWLAAGLAATLGLDLGLLRTEY